MTLKKIKNSIVKKSKKKCQDCGKNSVEYVHAIGWECLNPKCKSKVKLKHNEPISWAEYKILKKSIDAGNYI